MKGHIKERFNRAVKSETFGQFSRFFLVGLAAFSADAIILQGLVSFTELGPYWARLPSALTALLISWWFNRRYTFVLEKEMPVLNSLVSYVATIALSTTINLLIYGYLISRFLLFAQYPVLALVVASVIGLLINFILAKYWVFRK